MLMLQKWPEMKDVINILILNMLHLSTKLYYAMLYIAHWANKNGRWRCMQFAEIVTVASVTDIVPCKGR